MLAFRNVIGILFCLCSFNGLFARTFPYRFDYVSSHDGLSQLEAQCFLQDKRGLMWIGTKDGLNLYDAYTFKHFRNNPTDTNSLPDNNIKCLLEDREGMIWIGTSGGLSMYDPYLEEFSNFTHIPEDTTSLSHVDILDLFEDSRGNIWVGTGIGMSRLIRKGATPSDWSFRQYNTFSEPNKPDPHKLIGTTCRAIEEDSLGRIWFAFYTNVKGNLGKNTGALSRFDFKDSTFHHFTEWDWEGKEGSEYEIHTMMKARDQTLWVGTINQGLKKLELSASGDSLNLISYKYDPTNKNGLPHRFIKSILEDHTGNIWIGTFAGLAKMDKRKNGYSAPYFVPIHHPDNDKEITNPKIERLYLGQEGIIWIGTEVGLYKMIPNKKKFQNYREVSGPAPFQIGNSTFGMTEADNGDIWLANYGKGLSRITKQANGSESFYLYGIEEGLIDLSVIDVDVDKEGHVWASTFAGVNEIIYDNSHLQFVNYLPKQGDPQSIKTPYVYEVYQDQQGNIWMANFTGGLDRIIKDSAGTHFYNYMSEKGNLFSLPSNRLKAVQGDASGKVWVITGGISLLYEGEGKQLRFRHLFVDPTDHLKPQGEGIHHIYVDEEGIYWVGGKKGLYRIELLDAEKSPWEAGVSHVLDAEITFYGVEDGLPNSHVISILPDDHGNLWLSTYDGLSKFTPKTGQFRNYDYRDGIQGNEFNDRSYLKTQTGELLFGGVNGITRFHPDSIQDSKYVAPAIITSFKLFNEEVPVGKVFEKTGFLMERAISHTDHLELSHKEYVLSFEFVSPDFMQSEKVRYRYQLEGLEEDWVEAGQRRFATYTNLKAGEYIFKVKAANADGVWQNSATKLHLYMKPPPWKSWWAICLYVLAGILAIYGAFIARVQHVRREMRIQARVEQAKVEEREEVRAKSSRDFHDEAGNKLSKISLYTGLSKRLVNKDPELASYLDKIEEHIGELSGGMRDFIWVLDPKHDKLQDTVLRIQDFGKKLFEDTGITLSIKSNLPKELNPRLAVNTKRHILLIFKEAMNNAFKYAECNAIVLDFQYKDSVLVFELSDNGLGFDQQDLVRVNGLNNMKERAKEIGAELRIETVPALGTKIQLLYKIHPNG